MTRGKLVLTKRGRLVRDGWLLLIVFVPAGFMVWVTVSRIVEGL